MTQISFDTKKRVRFKSVVRILIAWYRKHQRSFIWREVGVTPYTVLVSEFMLQQTQARTVEARLAAFLQSFPTVEALADAKRSTVLRAWQGLGYNRRALNLHSTAQKIAKDGFPTTLETLLQLPGIGSYTASAILSFAWNKPVAVVDVNIERVLSRLWTRMSGYESVLPMKQVISIDEAVLPSRRSGLWHQALMDLGASVCTKRKPRCTECPLLALCPSGSHFIKQRAVSPAKKPSTEPTVFGLPNRIWRGRVLKSIAEVSPTSVQLRSRMLAYPESPSGQDPLFFKFVANLAEKLVSEGFCIKSKGRYRLAE